MKGRALTLATLLSGAALALGACDTIPIGEPRLVGTWEVQSINGVATGGGERFQLEFDRKNVSGRFGCNGFRGLYFDRDSLRFDDVAVTRMACTDMRFEQWGLGMMNQPLVVSFTGNGQMVWTDPPGQIVLRKLN